MSDQPTLRGAGSRPPIPSPGKVITSGTAPRSPVFTQQSQSQPGQPPTGQRAGAMGVARTAGGALVNWWRAATLEGLCVGVLWWIGLTLIHVPFAPLWAMIAALAAFIPHFGGVLSVIGPVLAVALSGEDYSRLGFVLGLYAVIVILDQLLIQPQLLKRTTRVPIWLSILAPIALGIIIPFWGVLLAPPLLAVVFAFRRKPDSPQPFA